MRGYARARQHAPVLARSAAFRGGFVAAPGASAARRIPAARRSVAAGDREHHARRARRSVAPGGAGCRAADAGLAAAGARAGGAAFRRAVAAGRRGASASACIRCTWRARSAAVYQTTFAGYVRHVRIEFARRELAASGSAARATSPPPPGSAIRAISLACSSATPASRPAEYRLALQPQRAKSVPGGSIASKTRPLKRTLLQSLAADPDIDITVAGPVP